MLKLELKVFVLCLPRWLKINNFCLIKALKSNFYK